MGNNPLLFYSLKTRYHVMKHDNGYEKSTNALYQHIISLQF